MSSVPTRQHIFHQYLSPAIAVLRLRLRLHLTRKNIPVAGYKAILRHQLGTAPGYAALKVV